MDLFVCCSASGNSSIATLEIKRTNGIEIKLNVSLLRKLEIEFFSV